MTDLQMPCKKQGTFERFVKRREESLKEESIMVARKRESVFQSENGEEWH